MAEKKTEICAEQIKTDEKYMREAIRQAKKAWKLDETPIGCVIVHEGRIIGTAGIRIRVLWPTRRSRRSGRPAKRSATGAWKSAPSM